MATSRPNLTAVILAAVILAVAGTTIFVALSNNDDSENSGTLYVLPVPIGTMPLDDPSVSTSTDESGTAERRASTGQLFGLSDEAGFVELRSVGGHDESPLDGGSWRPVDSPWGPAFVFDEDFIAVAIEGWSPVDARVTTVSATTFEQ